MRSIQGQLTLWLAIVLMVLSSLSGSALLLWIRRSMLQEFDRSLLANARAFQSLVTQKENGRLDVDVNLQALGDFTGRSATDYFAFEDQHGRTFASSDAARLASNEHSKGAGAWNTRLPNSAPARAVRIAFQPARTSEHDDEVDDSPPAAAANGQPVTLWLTVARDRRPLDEMLLGITVAVIAATVLFTLGSVVGAVLIVRRGLSALRGLASEVADVDLNDAAHRFDAAKRPHELTPIVDRLNELLGRVTTALQRERQFTAAVSHELRTPIAELRSAADVAMREPGDAGLARRAVVQAQEIAVQMQAMLSTLLSIATTERSADATAIEPVAVKPILELAIARRKRACAQRGLRVVDQVSGDVVVRSNAALLAAIIENVMSNACQYARIGSTIVIDCDRAGRTLDLRFENEQDALTPDDLPRIFDPFWRKDAARSQTQHVGLGLALVRAYARAIGGSVDATLTPAGRFRIAVRMPVAPVSGDASHSEVLETAGVE